MSMSGVECFIQRYMAINEQKLWSKDSYDWEVLNALSDLDKLVDYLAYLLENAELEDYEFKELSKIYDKWG